MVDLLESRKKGIPDPPHEVGIPDNIFLTREEEHLILEAIYDERFKNCSTYQEQIRVLHELLHNDDGYQVISDAKIGMIFHPPVSARAITKRLGKESSSNGRPLSISNEECSIIAAELNEHCKEAFPTISDIADFIAILLISFHHCKPSETYLERKEYLDIILKKQVRSKNADISSKKKIYKIFIMN